MGGPKRHRGQSGGPPFSKKPRRSKQFWQQRKTVEIAPIPKDDSDEGASSSGDDIEDAPTSYDLLLNAFAADKPKVDSDESNEEDEDNSDDDEVGSDGSMVEESPNGLDVEDGSDASDEENAEEESDEDNLENENGSGAEEDADDVSESESEDANTKSNDLEDLTDEDETDVPNPNSVQFDLTGGPRDPFVARYELRIPDELSEAVKNRDFSSEVSKWKKLGRLVFVRPAWTPDNKSEEGTKKPKKVVNIGDEEAHPEIRRSQMDLIAGPVNLVVSENGLEDQFVKLQLARNVSLANIKNISDTDHTLTHFQQEMFSIINSYRDFCFNDRNHSNGEEIRLVYTLHAVNHILKTRTKILNNNARISQAQKEGKKKKRLLEESNVNLRDQGLVRPKILIVVPFKESARRIVQIMIKLLFNKDSSRGTIMKKKKFDEEFGVEEEEATSGGNKPDDYYKTFSGNIDDGFKLGLAVTKKALKLYTDFYSSDILIVSPLGLRMVLENDYDFLSSIELLIMDQVDIFMMQNWEHVTFLMEKLHQRPKKSHGVDFSRVRLWTLDEMSPLYRQTLLFSSSPLVELNAIFNRSCHNYLGKLSTVNSYKTGTISSIALSNIPIVFHRVDSSSIATSIDDRFNYFVQKIMPEYKKDLMYHTLIVVPSYFDYVRIRNWFSKSDLDFSEICEYTKDSRIAQARDMFFHGEKHFLLYTERTHFYRRFTIKGIRHLIFYQLPQNPDFFSEICNLMQPAFLNRKGGSDGNMTCCAIYSKYDNLRLAQVCSTSKAEFMLSAKKNVHLFMPGGAS